MEQSKAINLKRIQGKSNK